MKNCGGAQVWRVIKLVGGGRRRRSSRRREEEPTAADLNHPPHRILLPSSTYPTPSLLRSRYTVRITSFRLPLQPPLSFAHLRLSSTLPLWRRYLLHRHFCSPIAKIRPPTTRFVPSFACPCTFLIASRRPCYGLLSISLRLPQHPPCCVVRSL